MVAYQVAVATSSVKCCSLFSINFGYVSCQPMSTFLAFVCADWKNGALELYVERVWGWQ